MKKKLMAIILIACILMTISVRVVMINIKYKDVYKVTVLDKDEEYIGQGYRLSLTDMNTRMQSR